MFEGIRSAMQERAAKALQEREEAYAAYERAMENLDHEMKRYEIQRKRMEHLDEILELEDMIEGRNKSLGTLERGRAVLEEARTDGTPQEELARLNGFYQELEQAVANLEPFIAELIKELEDAGVDMSDYKTPA